MAYAAVISLKLTSERLQSCHRMMLAPLPQVIFLYDEVMSLKQYIYELHWRRSCSEGVAVNRRTKAFEGEIKAAVWRLEDALQSHVSDQVLSQSEEEAHQDAADEDELFVVSLEGIEQEINSFAETVKKVKEDYDAYDGDDGGDDDEEEEETSIDLGGKMIGLSDELSMIREELTDLFPTKGTCFAVMGMAGIGKTTLVKEIFKDPLISSHFDCRAWVSVGPKCRFDRMLRCIIAQANPDIDEIHGENDVKLLGEYLRRSLTDKRYLIVLDDVWYASVRHELRDLLPDERRSRILMTTRVEVAAPDDSVHNMRFMNKEESWDLLREKVFGEEPCPHGLERLGRKIAENCEGLPLLIVSVAQILSESDKSMDFWHKVAKKQSSVFSDASEKISRVLLPSYEYLQEQLKAFFLYMGVFPQNHDITFSKLVKLWSAEGVLAPQLHETAEELAIECLESLVSRSLVMVLRPRTGSGTKAYALHSVFWHLCKRVGGENKLFHVLNSYADAFGEGIKGQRRLCIHNNILLGIKDVYKSIETVSAARSLLCYGASQQYPVSICSDLRLLTVLDALTIRFYEFPLEVLKLVHLRYLSLTYNNNLPPSISRLWNLRFLIVHRNLDIRSRGRPSYLPMEIWQMKELKHLRVTGRDLPDPCGASLPNLSTVLDVGHPSCTRSVLQGIPNLEKLGIRIELHPDCDDEPSSCFDHISNLHKLKSLKCIVVNPVFKSRAHRASSWDFPGRLKKLSLSGLGYPWEGMRAIALLPNLGVLKLRCYAFRGPDWVVVKGEFLKLKILLIEDSDLVNWRVGDGCFPALGRLIIKHCYVLEGLPLRNLNIKRLRKIEIVDSNPSVEASAKQLREDQMENLGYSLIDVNVHSSWKAKNIK